jgi:protein subunit release factor B
MDSAEQSARREAARAALAQDDDTLLGHCEVDYFVAGGPGGQHRNKTSSAVRLVHTPTGLTVTATERRSQFLNRSMAVERLRAALRRLVHVPKPRRPTRPSQAAKKRRLDAKRRHSQRKASRRDTSSWS